VLDADRFFVDFLFLNISQSNPISFQESARVEIIRSQIMGSRGLQSAAFYFQDRSSLTFVDSVVIDSTGEIFGAVAISGFEARLNATRTNFTDNFSITGASHIYGDQG